MHRLREHGRPREADQNRHLPASSTLPPNISRSIPSRSPDLAGLSGLPGPGLPGSSSRHGRSPPATPRRGRRGPRPRFRGAPVRLDGAWRPACMGSPPRGPFRPDRPRGRPVRRARVDAQRTPPSPGRRTHRARLLGRCGVPPEPARRPPDSPLLQEPVPRGPHRHADHNGEHDNHDRAGLPGASSASSIWASVRCSRTLPSKTWERRTKPLASSTRARVSRGRSVRLSLECPRFALG